MMLPNDEKLLGKLLILSLLVILVQVMLGGITRLTGSGLSMTDWNIIMDIFPPLTQQAWLEEFGQYKASPQYLKLNTGMVLSEFKLIYFWEWFHRVWGRVGFVFLLGILVYFGVTKKIDKTNILRFGGLLFLYLCQGLLGWWMVKSGLINNPYVSHYRLASHLLLAIVLFSFILWWVVQLLVPATHRLSKQVGFKKYAWFSVALIVVQIVFGAFMSGLKIAGRYASWPDMNGEIVPHTIFSMSPWYQNFLENAATIQFTHRILAYLLVGVILVYFWKAKQFEASKLYQKTLNLLPLVLTIQVALGIFTVITANGDKVSILLGAAHQIMGLTLLSVVLFLNFHLNGKKTA